MLWFWFIQRYHSFHAGFLFFIGSFFLSTTGRILLDYHSLPIYLSCCINSIKMVYCLNHYFHLVFHWLLHDTPKPMLWFWFIQCYHSFHDAFLYVIGSFFLSTTDRILCVTIPFQYIFHAASIVFQWFIAWIIPSFLYVIGSHMLHTNTNGMILSCLMLSFISCCISIFHWFLCPFHSW